MVWGSTCSGYGSSHELLARFLRIIIILKWESFLFAIPNMPPRQTGEMAMRVNAIIFIILGKVIHSEAPFYEVCKKSAKVSFFLAERYEEALC